VWINGGASTIWSFAPWNNGEDLYAWGDDYSKVNAPYAKGGLPLQPEFQRPGNFPRTGVTLAGRLQRLQEFRRDSRKESGCSNLAEITPTMVLPIGFQNQAVKLGRTGFIFKKQGRWETLNFISTTT